MAYGRPGVYVNEALLPAPIPTTGGTSAAGAAIGAFAQGPESVTLVTSWYDFVTKFGGYNANFPATFGVGQFFRNGGSELYVKRVLHTTDEDPNNNAAAAAVQVPGTDLSSTIMATIVAKNKGVDGNNLRVQITRASNEYIYNLTVFKEVVVANLGTNDADATNDVVVENFTNVVFSDINSTDFVETIVNNNSNYITVSVTDPTINPTVQPIDAVLPLTNGRDGLSATSADFELLLLTDGTSEFDTIDRPLVIFAPEAYAKFVVDGQSASAAKSSATDVAQALIAWAKSGLGYAVIDVVPNEGVVGALNYVDALTTTSQAAAYYPNYYIQDPLGRSNRSLRKIGPSSAVAGLYLSTDKSYGPFKAPAGIGVKVSGAISLERAFTPAELDSLNTGVYVSGGTTYYQKPVNAIRNLPGAGIAVMGARTLKQDGTANRYVNMRRSLIYIEKSLKQITQFAVFENNNSKLWTQLKTAIEVFLTEYRNQGGLRGASAADAFYVKIDGENNPPTTIANGEVHIEIGVALEYPAEFVVINLTQTTGV